MSDASQIPRLLATLLGVEPPAPSGPRRAAPPPQAPTAASLPGPAVARPGPAAERVGRRPAEQPGADAAVTPGLPAARVPRPEQAPPGTRRTVSGQVRAEVRRALAVRESLRTGIVVAEVLGSPRALRPYGTSEPS